MKIIKKIIVYLPFLAASIFANNPINYSHQDDWSQNFKIQKLLAKEESSFQKIMIFENQSLGKVMLLDNIIQYSTKDEFILHEMLTHPPLFSHQNPKNVLIIGGGDGCCAYETLKHPSVEEVTVVEIDAKLVDICNQFLPELHRNIFEKPQVNLIIKNGFQFLKQTKKKYDVIIVNSSDPINHAAQLYDKNFYNLCLNALHENGILATLAGDPITQISLVSDVHQSLSKMFSKTQLYIAPTPSHLGGLKMFCLCANHNQHLINDFDEITKRYRQSESEFKHYEPEAHQASFVIPKVIRNKL